MGYYTIRLFTDSQDTMIMITEFGKFKYDCLPMGMCASVDIFQDKIDQIISDIKGVKTYTNNRIVLIKDLF